MKTHKKILLYFISLFFISSCEHKTEIKKIPDVNDGLVAEILFDGNYSENFSGIIGKNYKTNFIANRKGDKGKALQFSGSDSSQVDFGNISACSFPNSVFSFSFWVAVSDTSKPGCVLSKRSISGPFEYSIDNHFNHSILNFDNWISSGATTVYGSDPLSASAHLTLNKWQHIFFTADGNLLKVYINGILQSGTDLKNSTQIFSSTSSSFVVGNGGGWGRNYYFNGSVDDIKIYNKVLNDEQIKYLFLK